MGQKDSGAQKGWVIKYSGAQKRWVIKNLTHVRGWVDIKSAQFIKVSVIEGENVLYNCSILYEQN